MNYPYNYQNYQVPQMQQINPYQQFQPQQPQVKVVNSFNEITANDVPMNVPFSIFAKNDMSEIQVRKWNSNGLIDNLTFKPIVEQKIDQHTTSNEKSVIAIPDEVLQGIYKHIDSKFDELLDLLTQKEVVANES